MAELKFKIGDRAVLARGFCIKAYLNGRPRSGTIVSTLKWPFNPSHGDWGFKPDDYRNCLMVADHELDEANT